MREVFYFENTDPNDSQRSGYYFRPGFQCIDGDGPYPTEQAAREAALETAVTRVRRNFDTLLLAIRAGRCAVLEARDRATGEPVALVCGLNHEENGDTSFVPFAVMIDGNPYDMYDPPNPDGGFIDGRTVHAFALVCDAREDA